MKAVCLLLCLALARNAAGSIFRRRHYPSMDSVVAQSPDYIDPYVQQYLQQQYVNLKPSQYWAQEQNNRPVQYQNQEQEEFYQKQQERRPEQQTISRYTDSLSAEIKTPDTVPLNTLTSNQYDSEYAAPRFADKNTPVIASRMAASEPLAFGDAVAWRGLEIATSPSTPVNKKDIEKIFREAQYATKHIQPETKTELHKAVEAATQTHLEDASLNATELLKKYEYPVEEHTIKTEDGYYLTLFRISSKQLVSEDKPREVVFLMHGLLGSADDWLLMGPGKSLAYKLADAGFDVWLGNARGNKYTRHVSKHRAQPDFWQFSNDEIALFDLPAMIDYVLQMTEQPKMYYVGHSQGTTVFFALAAARPAYNDKIKMMFALSPMVFMSGVRSPLVRMIAPSSKFYERLVSQLGAGEFRPHQELVHTIGGAMCENEIGCKEMCSNAYIVISGVNVDNLEASQIPSIMGHLPAGGSMKQMKQYGQGVDSQEFRMYDYGSEMNEKVYGQPEAPKYEMSNVSTPVVLYYSEHDWLAHPKDVERLQKVLPNATAHKLNEKYFSHMDFQFSKQAPEVIHKDLIETISNEQNIKTQKQRKY